MSSVDIVRIHDAIAQVDLDDLVNRMRLYAAYKLSCQVNYSSGDVSPTDLVQDVFKKVLDGTRVWNEDVYSFEEFLFGVINSLVSDIFRKRGKEIDRSKDLDVSILSIATNESMDLPDDDFEMIKAEVLEDLKGQGCNDLELKIFDCWAAGYSKSKEIAELEGVDVVEVYKATKRLLRRTVKIRDKWAILKKI